MIIEDTILLIISQLPHETASRIGFQQKGLLRRLGAIRSGDFSKVYVPVDIDSFSSLG